MGSILPKPTLVCLCLACFFDMNQTISTPVTLIFGPFDPTGSDGLPADAITCAALGGHAICALTAITIQDSTKSESVLPCLAEQIDDQARCVLEDIPVLAIKVGALSSVESASAVAQIAADYSQIPLVLHLGTQEIDTEAPSEEEDEVDDLVGAIVELLVPQAYVLVIEARRLTQWITDDALQASGHVGGAQTLQALGAQWVLIAGVKQRPGHLVNVLTGPENETFSWPCAAGPERTRDSGGIIATALASLLARGLSVPKAAEQACAHAGKALLQAFQPGMGHLVARRIPIAP